MPEELPIDDEPWFDDIYDRDQPYVKAIVGYGFDLDEGLSDNDIFAVLKDFAPYSECEFIIDRHCDDGDIFITFEWDDGDPFEYDEEIARNAASLVREAHDKLMKSRKENTNG